MNRDIRKRFLKALDSLNQVRDELEIAEFAMMEETREYTKKMEVIIADIWRLKCEVNIVLQDWSMR